MSKETKFGYGFLLAGVGLPHLIEKLLGDKAAMLAAVLCVLAGVCLLAAGHLHERKGLSTKIILGVLLVILIAAGVAWRVYRRSQKPTIADNEKAATTKLETQPPKKSEPAAAQATQLAGPNSPKPQPSGNKPSVDLQPSQREPTSVNQNCPGGICAGGNISGSPTINNFGPLPPPAPTIKICVSRGELRDGIYLTTITFATDVEVVRPGFFMFFDGPVDNGKFEIDTRPLGLGMERADNNPNSLAFRIISIDMSRDHWYPGDGPIKATITSKSPVNLTQVIGGRGEGDGTLDDKIVLRCD